MTARKKKKILVMPDGNWLAHVSRPLAIATKLRDMGHEVLFACEGEYTKLPRKKGFEVLPIKTISPERVLECARKSRVNWYDYALLKECVDEDVKILGRIKPDMVLGDYRLSLSTSCELAGLPLAMTLNASWTNYYAVNIRPPEHLKVTRVLGERVTGWFSPWIKSLVLNYDCLPFRRFRRDLGLKRVRRNLWDVMEGDLNLLTDIPEYGPTNKLPPNFHYIGPLTWEPDMKAPAWLEELDPERPVIYFTMGSTGHARFFEQAVELFGDSPYQCVMTTAGMVKLPSVPKNFFVADYAPGTAIMEKSDVVVCQGGNGTIYQAMSRGVPVIGIPTMHDQEFNMQRVVDLGIGIQLSELKFRSTHLVEAVEKIFADKSYTNNAQRYGKALEQCDGPAKGAELIDAYLRRQKT